MSGSLCSAVPAEPEIIDSFAALTLVTVIRRGLPESTHAPGSHLTTKETYLFPGILVSPSSPPPASHHELVRYFSSSLADAPEYFFCRLERSDTNRETWGPRRGAGRCHGGGACRISARAETGSHQPRPLSICLPRLAGELHDSVRGSRSHSVPQDSTIIATGEFRSVSAELDDTYRNSFDSHPQDHGPVP